MNQTHRSPCRARDAPPVGQPHRRCCAAEPRRPDRHPDRRGGPGRGQGDQEGPRVLPGAIEPLAGYQPQTTCSPRSKPGVANFASRLLAAYPTTRSLGIVRSCSVGGLSEHKEGRAFDWGVSAKTPGGRAKAARFLTWLLKKDKYGNEYAMARRLGIQYVIWNRKIWGSYNASPRLAEVHRRQPAHRPRAHLVHLGRRAGQDVVLDRQGRQHRRRAHPDAADAHPDADPHAHHAELGRSPAPAAGARGRAARRAGPRRRDRDRCPAPARARSPPARSPPASPT